MKTIHRINIFGVRVDDETRCAHYHSKRDIIAIKFKCCDNWFACHKCHAELVRHPAGVWPRAEFDTRAVFCGGCGHQLTIREYLKCGFSCTCCYRKFNPGCAGHHYLYFEVISLSSD